jgi:hypothetical protein
MPAVIHSLKTPGCSAAEKLKASEPSPRRPQWVRSFARDPLFRFIVLGLLVWVGVEYWTAHHSRYTIDIGPAERQRIAMGYLQQFGQLPTPGELKELIDRRIRDEIFLREGVALGLDNDDEIVRRRIVQKYEFLQTDLAMPSDPEPGVLERWFEENRERYLTPEQVAFSHVYFSVDKGGEHGAKSSALNVLRTLRTRHVSRAPDQGDAFPGLSDVPALAPDEAMRLFGDSELSRTLFTVPVGQWAGPYRSGYGWHLVFVSGHQPAVLPTLIEIHDRVVADYLEAQRQILSERAYENLRAKYTIRYGRAP